MRFALLGLLLVSSMGFEARADQFVLDKQHTEIRFSWDHLGLSRQSGKFTDLSGTVSFDGEKPDATTVNVTIPVASMNTGVPPLDTALVKTKDYFDVPTHPTITFKSTSVRVTGDKTAELEGNLSINGVTKPITLAVVWNFLGQHPLGAVNPTFAGKIAAGFSARTQILRSEWGMSRLIPLVSDEIRISIEAEMHRQE
ncbi:MAG: YceI family protein [Hyphomicrobiaceae bacterium]